LALFVKARIGFRRAPSREGHSRTPMFFGNKQAKRG
jgi:hypothetical protein